MPIERSTEINHRVDFAKLANSRGVKKIVEVGTHQGVFARQLMAEFSGELVCVDPYLPYTSMEWGRQADLMQAVLAVQPWHGRVTFIMAKSPDCLQAGEAWLWDGVGFVYIDGDHDGDAVARDMAAWWDMLPADGILAGHDFDPTHLGVMQVVDMFAELHGCIVRITQGDPEPSWYIYKTEPRTLHQHFFQGGEAPNPHCKDAQ